MNDSKENKENTSKDIDIDEIYLDYPFVNEIKRVLKESKKREESKEKTKGKEN